LVDNGNIQWIIFEYECIILSRKLTPNVTKQQVTKPNKSNDETATVCKTVKIATLLIIPQCMMGTPVSESFA